MKEHALPADTRCVQTVSDLYQQAAQSLLLAYQRNKQATRHHTDGAFRAALHHARMSCEHAAQAHECLQQALTLSLQFSVQPEYGAQPCIGHDQHQ